MSLNRWAKTRDSNEGDIIKVFELAGASVEKIDTPCDLIIGFLGRSYLVEIKTEKGTLTPKQKSFIRNWKGDYYIVRTIEQALELINNLRKRQS